MIGKKITILQEIFPNHFERIVKLMQSNVDLESILEDLLECHQVLTKEPTEHTNASVPKEYWEELYNDLKNEAIDLVSKEMS